MKKISLGEAATEFGISVTELLRRMKKDAEYGTENGHFVFTIGEPELREAKKEDIPKIWRRLRNELGPGPTAEEWDALTKEYLGGVNGIVVPSSEYIKNLFGCGWTSFLREVKSKKAEREYEIIKKAFLEIDERRSTPNEVNRHKTHKGRVHDLIMRDIAKQTGLKREYIHKILVENGLLDGGYIAEKFGSIELLTTTPICGLRIYDGFWKKRKRQKICDAIKASVNNPHNFRYIGLPGVNFIDYCLFQNKFGIVPHQSLAVERGRKEANIMRSILNHYDVIEGGSIFKGLNFYEGPMHDAVSERLGDITKEGFNLAFLDYQSSWGKDKEEAVRNLFEYQNLADNAFLFINLNKSSLEISRFERGRGHGQNGYKTKDQEGTCWEYIENWCKEGNYHCDVILEDSYKDTVDMKLLGFMVTKAKPHISVSASLPIGD